MSMYSTGELAKRCGVSVRTVQYYDTRGILVPSALSEGGRRLYTEEDCRQLEIICFLRDTGLSISSISQLLNEPDPGSVISVLLNQREQELRGELADCQEKLALLGGIRSSLKTVGPVSLESIGDIAHLMKNRKKLRRVRTVLLSTAIPMGIMEWSAIGLWIFQGIRWLFVLYTLLAVPYTVWLLGYYWRHVGYICPRCHRIFRPTRRELFFARHTATTRRLTCTCCAQRSFCVENYFEEENPS